MHNFKVIFIYTYCKYIQYIILQILVIFPMLYNYILEPILHPMFCVFHSLNPRLPLPSTNNHVCSLYHVNLLLFGNIHYYFVFFRFHI